MLRTWPNTISHEELFVERYSQLLQWSMKLANGDRQLAEDIVHDAFIQFTLGRPDLNGIQNLDGYLYATLRNRFLSHVRRSAKSPIDRLSAVDYDSAEISLRASDQRSVMQVHEELHLICRYACERKETSKAGSVLILRFIHAYYPTEIARIMKGTRQAVDIWIRLARSEAKLYVESPRSLSPLENVASRTNRQHGLIVPEDKILSELRLETHRYKSADCSSVKRLEEIYSDNNHETVNCKLLAHVVSCPRCLEAISKVLELAPPADRYPTDKPGPWPPSGERRKSASQLKTSRLRTEEVVEHHPAKLIVAVNGFFVGAQAVSSGISDLTLSVNVDERIGFVDILSDQGLLLLALNVEAPPDGPVEQTAQVELSAGRSLQASLTFLTAQPTLQVVYRDPHFLEAATQHAPIGEESALDAELISETAPRSTSFSPRLPMRRHGTWLDWLRQSVDPGFWLRPGIITAALTVVVAIAVFLYTGTRPVSASQLLARAELAEQAFLNTPGTVIHRSMALEVRDSSRRGPATRKRIEVWQTSGAETGSRRVARLYDESGKLEASEWTRPDGSRALYRDGRTSATNPLTSLPADSNEMWRLDLSARDFSAIVGDVTHARVDQQAKTFVISYVVPNRVSSSGLVQAALTLSKVDLHAIEQNFVVQRGAEKLEGLFSESGIERLPSAAAPPDALNPDVKTGGLESPRGSDASTEPSNSSAATILPSMAASPDLEVEVAYLLDRVNATTGEQVALTRVPDGRLLVSGIVDSDRRKAEIIEGLRPVSANRAVRIDISTVAEAMKRSTPPSRGTTQKLDLSESSTFPMYADLNAFFARRGVPSGQIDDEVNRLSTRVLTLSRTALSHAWALRRLAAQFKPDAALSPEAQEKRLSMLRSHAAALRQQTERLRSELQAIFGGTAIPFEESSQVKDESDLRQAIDNLVQQTSANDRAIQSAFTISASSAQVSNLRSPQFFESLRRVESRAARITEFNR